MQLLRVRRQWVLLLCAELLLWREKPLGRQTARLTPSWGQYVLQWAL
jgi:hypothetical protein